MADKYISPTGNDTTGDGLTPATAWATISKAVTSSASGDTIHCAAGTYTWVSQNFPSARTVVGDAGAAVTIFDGGGAVVAWSADTSLDVSDLTFQNANRNSFPNIFENNTGTAVMSFTNCIFDSLTSTAGRGIFGKNSITINGGSLTMIGCRISNCSGTSGPAYFGVNACTLSFIIHNCTFHSNVATGITMSFFDNAGGGSPAVNFDLRNNIVVNDNGTPQLWHSAGGGGVTYTSTVAASNIARGFTSLPAGMSAALTSDPLFVNAAGGNFNLRPGSPAIDAGVII